MLCLVIVVCVLLILWEVAKAKVGYEGVSGIGLHDVKQGIKKKKKKIEVTFSSPKYKNKLIAISKVMSYEILSSIDLKIYPMAIKRNSNSIPMHCLT